MATGTKTQMTTQVNDYLLTWVEGFLVDRKARGLVYDGGWTNRSTTQNRPLNGKGNMSTIRSSWKAA